MHWSNPACLTKGQNWDGPNREIAQVHQLLSNYGNQSIRRRQVKEQTEMKCVKMLVLPRYHALNNFTSELFKFHCPPDHSTQFSVVNSTNNRNGTLIQKLQTTQSKKRKQWINKSLQSSRIYRLKFQLCLRSFWQVSSELGLWCQELDMS